MGRYFGREPRYSQQEAEAQAQQAIDAAVNKGRPPDEEWKALGSRMGDINRELAARPPVDLPSPPPRPAATEERATPNTRRPRAVNQILRPPPAPEEAAPAPAKRSAQAASPAAATPAKRAARGTEKRPPGAAKRQPAKKRPG